MRRIRGRRYPARFWSGQVVVGLTLVGAVIFLFPIVWMMLASVRPIAEVLDPRPKLIPSRVTGEYIARLVKNAQYRHYFTNSLILASSCAVVSTGLGVLAAYGFSRFRMIGAKIVLLGMMALLMLPPVTLIIPYFQLARALRFYDTVFGLVLVNVTFVLPMAVWLLKAYFDSIPVELEESAMVDGCSRIKALWRIAMPLAVPGLVGVASIAFVASWNEFLFAVSLTDSLRSQPLTVGLALFFGQFVRDWNSIMALSTISSLPLVVMFAFVQRWVVQGMTSGAIK